MLARISIVLLWLSVISLLVIGLVMVSSTSSVLPSSDTGGNPYHFIQRQCVWAVIGLVAAGVLSAIDYRHAGKFTPYIWLGCCGLLVLCFVPGIGKNIFGENRWIVIAGIQFQPSEAAKICIMICVSYWYSTQAKLAHGFVKGFMLPGIILGIPIFLILIEKDMGTAAALSLACFCLMFAAGARIWALAQAVLMGSLVLYIFTISSENRMERIYAWFDPEGTKLGVGRQQWIAIVAFARGGWDGLGLGNGVEKLANLTLAHSDFIYAAIGEELGLRGTGLVLLLFGTFFLSGIALACTIKDKFGRLLIIALCNVIFWPAMLNMMVVCGIVPNTGLPLPFISYGGTNLACAIASVGIITSVYIHDSQRREMYWPRKQMINISDRI